MMSISELDATPTHSGPITQMQESSAAVGRADRSLPRPVLSFEIPEADLEFFRCQLPPAVQIDVERMLKFAEIIDAEVNVTAACKRLAAQLARKMGGAAPRGWKAKSIQRKYYEFTSKDGVTRPNGEYIEPHSWEIFWDKARFPDPRNRSARTANIPAEFVQFLRANHDNNQRGKFAQVYNALLHLWRTHYTLTDMEFPTLRRVIKANKPVAQIPGYREWPAAAEGAQHPAGWSLSNLQRKCERDNFERDAVTIGRQAASQHGLMVRTTRTTLGLCERVQFDDHEFNQKIILLNQREFLRPRGFSAVDQLTDSLFMRGLKPTLWDLALEKKEALTEKDFQWFVTSWLMRYGWNKARGTTMVVELGLATIRAPFEERIREATRGAVTVHRTGRHNERGHAGQLRPVDDARPDWRRKGRGNFRGKPHVESIFSLVDNAFASMPGQTGLNRDRCPEQLPMIEKEVRELLSMAERMSPEQAAQLDYPMLFWHEWFWQAEALFAAIDCNDRHEIEGWEKLGFIKRPLMDDRGQIVAPARRMSRREAFQSMESQLTRLPWFQLPTLVGIENCYRAGKEDTVLVQRGEIMVDNREWTGESDPIYFLAHTGRERLPNGERYRAYLNPFDPSFLILCDAQERPIAACPRRTVPGANELEKVTEELGKQKQWYAQSLDKANERHIGGASEIGRRREHNANVIAGRSLRDEENAARALEERNAKRAAAEPDDISAFGDPEPTKERNAGDSTANEQLDALNEF